MQNETNPLLNLGFRIPFDSIEARHLVPGITHLIAAAEKRVDAIADTGGQLTYDNTLGALEEATEELELASSVIGHLESVATSKPYREAYQEVQPVLSRFWTGLTFHEGLWKTLKEFSGTDRAHRLDDVRKRHLKLTLDEFRRHGADLDAAGKERIREINIELAELTTRFSQNLLDATNEFELVITDENRLAGLPESAREAAREAAVARKLEGWRFTLQAPSVIPVLTYLDDRELRATVWSAHVNRAAAEPHDNRPLIKRILTLRKEKAELLGFSDFADLVLENRMAGNGDTAWEFVLEMKAKTVASFAAENESLQAFANRTGLNGPLQAWDTTYYAEKQRRAVYQFDEEALRPYFPVESVIAGLFATASNLYGVAIEETDDLPVWNSDVLTYRMTEDGRHIASFYVDLFPRENKRGGAWMNSLISAPPGQPHLGLICANFNSPVGGKPALLTHREVETLFHEFGHLMHHCLSEVPVRSLAGTNVAWDFVELPSQIMENWCWERESLDTFSRHYMTGESIPDELFAKLVKTRTFRAANGQMRQLAFASLDLMLHRDFDPDGDRDLMAYSRDILQSFSPVELPEQHGFLAGFGHLFSGSVAYAAGYYSYKWAEVLDADAFTAFRENGVFDQSTGSRFRRSILSRGDSRDPGELYREFMGRDPNQDALLERLGLTGD